MIDPTVSQVCADAAKVAVEKQHEGLPVVLTMLVVGSFVFFALTVMATHWATQRIDARLEKSRESVREMLEEHRRCSELMVQALSNPLAYVTLRFTPGGQFAGVETSAPIMTKGGKA